MKKRIIAAVMTAVLMLVGSGVSAMAADTLNVPHELEDVYAEYESDPQFQMMLEDYGEEYAIQFLRDVMERSGAGSSQTTRGGGGNECYQYVTLIQQTKTYNCGTTTVLQSLYGMNAQGNVSGSSNSAKIATLDSKYNVDSQGSLYVYQAVNALNTYGTSTYVYTLGSGLTAGQFETDIANSLMCGRPVVLHANTKAFTYYGGKSTEHYLSLDYVNRTKDLVRIVDCNYNSSYYGIHTSVPLSEAYNSVNAYSGRYLIY